MNERGFFTIVGLCLLLVAAIFIKGVHAFEANYSSGITTLQVEHELQNAADTALIEASNSLESFADVEEFIQFNIPVSKPSVSDRLKNFSVKVYGEHSKMVTQTFDRKNNRFKPKEPDFTAAKKVTVIISVASCDNPFIDGKIYRRSLAYILKDSPETIHYCNEFDKSIKTYLNRW